MSNTASPGVISTTCCRFSYLLIQLQVLGTQVTDSEIRPVYQKIQQHVEVLEQSTARVSSRAEQLGAVQQVGHHTPTIELT